MVYIILGQGFEEIEAVAPCDILRRVNVPVCFAAVGNEKAVSGSHGITVAADVLVSDITPSSGDIIVIPGGMGGVNSIKADETAMKMISAAAKSGSGLAAICAGPSVFAVLGLIDGKQITCYPGCENMMGKAICSYDKSTVTDGKLITGRAPGSAIDFGLALLTHIKGSQWAEKIRMELVY